MNKKGVIMRRLLKLMALFVLITMLFIMISYAAELGNMRNHLICDINQSCLSPNVALFTSEEKQNSHVAMPSNPDGYPYSVCCGNVMELTTESGTNLVNLADITDSHVEYSDYSYYTNSIYLGWAMNRSRDMHCELRDNDALQDDPVYPDGGCYWNQTCLFVVQNPRSSHITNCSRSITGGYSLCCDNCIPENEYDPADPAGTKDYSYCHNGLDDDCDNETDCEGSACQVTISGRVTNSTNEAGIFNASVYMHRFNSFVAYNGQSEHQVFTDADGNYELTVCFDFMVDYEIVVSKPFYTTYSGLLRMDQNITDYNLNITPEGSYCQADCTKTDSANVCDATCDGVSGCSYYDSTAKTMCSGKTRGMEFDYNSTHTLTCCGGTPYVKEMATYDLNVDSDNVVTSSNYALFNGRIIKVVGSFFT